MRPRPDEKVVDRQQPLAVVEHSLGHRHIAPDLRAAECQGDCLVCLVNVKGQQDAVDALWVGIQRDDRLAVLTTRPSWPKTTITSEVPKVNVGRNDRSIHWTRRPRGMASWREVIAA